MKFIDEIKRETLVLCSDSFKEKIFKLNKLIPVKLMNLNEFIKKKFFDYDERTVIYVMNKYNVKYEVALMYINNLYYIENKDYGIKKLDFLCEIKRDLDSQGLLIYNDGFINYIKNVDIVIYGIRMTKFISSMLDGFKYKLIERDYSNYEHDVYAFNTMEEEVEYVAYNICKLIDGGITTDKIKLMNVDSSYYNTIERIFSLFNLKVNISYKSKLSSYDVVKQFISLYKENSLDDALKEVDSNDKMYDELVKVLNKYLKYDDKDLIIYKLENSYVSSERYNNAIEIVDHLEYISSDDEYIFMLGFNDGLIPNSYKDTEYITDNIKEYVNIDNTRVLNYYLREDIIKNIRDIKNLTITYKSRDIKKSYYPSTLCSNFNVLDGRCEYKDSYSEIYNKIKLTRMYDEYIKYGHLNDNFRILNSNFKIDYNSYSNKYKKIDRVMEKLTLSYSKMQIYNKCAFRYYLSEILKLDIFEENFSTVIGSMVHFVMEKCLANNDLDTDKYVSLFLADRKFTKKEKFFLEKYKECIRDLLNQVILEKEYMLFNQAMYEKKITIDYGDNVKFVGIIDKVLYYIDGNNTYISLIDYKTGNDIISLKYLKYGLDIQLPIYLYLSSKLEFNNPLYAGFYLQKFNIKDKDYRLIGYSNSDKNILSVMDNNYDNSKIIKSMKTLKDGSFSKNSKVLSNEEIGNIINETEEKILEVIEKIKENDFEINPKEIDGINKSCEFCKFRDICNVQKKDMVIIKTEDLEVGEE